MSPSAWIERFADAVPAGGTVLDVACGGGRHTRFFAERGHPVVAVDRDLSRVAELAGDAPSTSWPPISKPVHHCRSPTERSPRSS